MNDSEPSGTSPSCASRRKKSVKPGEVTVRERVVEIAEIVAAHRSDTPVARAAAAASSSRWASPQARDSSSRRCTALHAPTARASRRAAHTANTNGSPVHVLPLGAQVEPHRIPLAPRRA